MKRILLVAEDQIVSNYHRVRFELLGVSVDVARTFDAARRMARDRNPDMAVIDPIMTGFSPIQAVETLREMLGEREIWTISQLPGAVGKAMSKAGATRVMAKGEELRGSFFDRVADVLGLPGSDGYDEESEREIWLQAIAKESPEMVNALRFSLHDFVKEPRKAVGLYDLFRQSHQLSHRATMLGLVAVGRLTTSLEALIYDLYATPEQINPSIVRTVSQAIDFMGVLFEENNLRSLTDPAVANVFVVDDEPPARQMISAAMKLAGLKITPADNAEMALTVLADNHFELIFLDVNMPKTTGFELCEQIRRFEEHRKTPVVFITGMNTFQNRAKGSLSGGDDFIGKPFNLLELGVKALIWIFKGQLAA
jgi:DNA-binding response OmpR family regulator